VPLRRCGHFSNRPSLPQWIKFDPKTIKDITVLETLKNGRTVFKHAP
jgi:predicted amidohydrolase YtcJ